MHLGHGEWVIRFLNVLLSTATVPVVYALGSLLFNRRTGMLAALLLAVHPYHLMLAQRARSYPLTVLLVSLSALLFVRLLQKPSSGTVIGNAVVSAAAVYSHFFALLVIAAQLSSVLLRPRSRVPWKILALSWALLAILLVPFGWFALTHASTTHVEWVQDLSVQQTLRVLYSLTLSKGRCVLYVILWCAAGYAGVREVGERRWPYHFLFAWLMVPLALTTALSLRHPLMIERYLSVCLPASALVASAGAIALSRFSRPLAFGIVAAVIFYSAMAIRFYDKHPEYAEGWREASLSILQRVQPGDAVIAESLIGYTFDYYRDTFSSSLPPFARMDSFAASLPIPLPENVWILASVRFNPNWRGAVPGATEAAVQKFAAAHTGEYCPAPPYFEAGEARVWHFRRCSETLPEGSSE
jgi:mannosyltransferase